MRVNVLSKLITLTPNIVLEISRKHLQWSSLAKEYLINLDVFFVSYSMNSDLLGLFFD